MHTELKRDVETSRSKSRKSRAPTEPAELDPLAIRDLSLEIAREEHCDPRSVVKVIRGEVVRGHLGDRIASALRRRRVQPGNATRRVARHSGPEAA